MSSYRRIGAVAALVLSASMAVLNAGVANADPDIIGKQYGEAKGLLGEAGMTPVVATVLGDRLEEDKCYVVSMTRRTPLDSSGNATADNQVQVNLNCHAAQSDTQEPGFSKGNLSPEAVAARATHEKLDREWKQGAEGQKWCAESEAQHPEWAPIDNCHSEAEAKRIRREKWLASPEGVAWCAKSEVDHPDWAPIEGCHSGDVA